MAFTSAATHCASTSNFLINIVELNSQVFPTGEGVDHIVLPICVYQMSRNMTSGRNAKVTLDPECVNR